MPVSSEKKKEYNERYRSKLKQNETASEKSTVSNTQSISPVITPKNENFFFNVGKKMLETSILALLPIVLKLVHSQIASKKPPKEQESEPLNLLNNIPMSVNF